jgi:ADP-heptose:LPS heptosyltransferase
MRERRHIAERERDMLATAGVPVADYPDLSFLTGDLSDLELPGRFALLVPGSAPSRPEKRWPAGRYAALASALAHAGIAPLLIGTEAEGEALDAIRAGCPAARDLRGRTDFGRMAELARRAELAVGNDTGPMHLIAAAGCPTLSLFSDASDPVKVAPRGPRTARLQRARLADLGADEVLGALQELTGGL